MKYECITKTCYRRVSFCRKREKRTLTSVENSLDFSPPTVGEGSYKDVYRGALLGQVVVEVLMVRQVWQLTEGVLQPRYTALLW